MSALLQRTLQCCDGEGAKVVELPKKAAATEPSQILGTRWNLLVSKNSPFLRGTRGVVLLNSWVWKDVNGWALEIGISCTYSNPVVTGGQKHTHTHTYRWCWHLCPSRLTMVCPW
jgi:hypothetical protein